MLIAQNDCDAYEGQYYCAANPIIYASTPSTLDRVTDAPIVGYRYNIFTQHLMVSMTILALFLDLSTNSGSYIDRNDTGTL
jgi:hypothetical protein